MIAPCEVTERACALKSKFLRSCARALRADSTDAELRLWCFLRSRRMGAKFRRQYPIGPYIVDFVSLDCRLIVEVDGGQHQEHAQRDRRRDEVLTSRGFLVLRFWNHDVLARTTDVLEQIWARVQERRPSPPPPLPLPRERGEERGFKSAPTLTPDPSPAAAGGGSLPVRTSLTGAGEGSLPVRTSLTGAGEGSHSHLRFPLPRSGRGIG
jgi:very-short-patch-repair endonuclease